MMKFVILLIVSIMARQSYGEPPISKRIARPVAAPRPAPRPIVGGQDAALGQFKHQVSIWFNGKHDCGGTIISPTHILTAGHCIPRDKRQYSLLSIRTGTTKWRQGQKHEIKCIQVHPNYVSYHDNDVAVITVTKPIIFNNVQAPIRMASRNYGNDNGTPATASGWGRLGEGLPIPEDLKYVHLKILPVSQCGAKAGPLSHYVCTFLQRGKGACRGDSGGPLISNGEVIGVVSHGTPCAVGDPDIYANVYFYKSFIQECQRKCP